MIRSEDVYRRQIAAGLETSLNAELGEKSGWVDEPEGLLTVEVSVTLMREIIRALKGTP